MACPLADVPDPEPVRSPSDSYDIPVSPPSYDKNAIPDSPYEYNGDFSKLVAKVLLQQQEELRAREAMQRHDGGAAVIAPPQDYWDYDGNVQMYQNHHNRGGFSMLLFGVLTIAMAVFTIIMGMWMMSVIEELIFLDPSVQPTGDGMVWIPIAVLGIAIAIIYGFINDW